MNTDDKARLLKQVNASGFPFQIRVQHEVETSYQQHPWRVVASEHPWIHQDGAEGFIDLVLAKISPTGNRFYMVIECKRSLAGSWVFLHSGISLEQKNDVSLLHTAHDSDGEIPPIWTHAMCDPESPISSFCSVPGQADKATPMLERIVGTLLLSVEGLSQEMDMRMLTAAAQASQRSSIYIPVLVTNTPLVICRFDPTEVGLTSGVLEGNGGEFEPAPFVRFRKSLTTTSPSEEVALSLQDANRESQRTVLVVHAPHLLEFLRQWSIR